MKPFHKNWKPTHVNGSRPTRQQSLYETYLAHGHGYPFSNNRQSRIDRQ